jgi:hypothetical protein
MSPQIPTIGRTVIYVMPAGHSKAGMHRPAVVTIAWSDLPDAAVNLHVLIDPANDEPLAGEHQCSVAHDPEGKQPRSWHWPQRN